MLCAGAARAGRGAKLRVSGCRRLGRDRGPGAEWRPARNRRQGAGGPGQLTTAHGPTDGAAHNDRGGEGEVEAQAAASDE